MELELKIWFDGACSNAGNKQMGIGVVGKVYSSGVVTDISTVIKNHGVGTSNIAEWIGCCYAMEMISHYEKMFHGQIKYIQVFSDSQLITNQFNDLYQIKMEKLVPYYNKAKRLKGSTRYRGKVMWIKRDYNKEADRLSKMGLLCGIEHYDVNN